MFVLLIVNVLLALFNLGFFNVGNSEYIGGGYATGFDITGHPKEVNYCNASFIASFVNPYTTQINIKSVSAYEYLSGGDCIAGRNGSFPLQQIDPKSQFNISLSCPIKSDGEAYKLGLTVYYSDPAGGIKSDHADSGIIYNDGGC